MRNLVEEHGLLRTKINPLLKVTCRAPWLILEKVALRRKRCRAFAPRILATERCSIKDR
jgi:hypothetical protein